MPSEINIAFLIGPARSGTTMLGYQTLSRHPDIEYWGEPVYLWRRGHVYNRYDNLNEEDLTSGLRDYLRKKFASKLEKSGKKLLVEKTPSNCFRIKYLQSVFPEAKFIYVTRDGRDVAHSAMKEWRNEKSESIDSKSFRKKNILQRLILIVLRKGKLLERFDRWRAFTELPYYLFRYFRYLYRTITKKAMVWGPNFQGLSDFAKKNSLAQTCAYQWQQSHLQAVKDLGDVPDKKIHRIRYEALIENPRNSLTELLNFLEIDSSDIIVNNLSGIIKYRKSKELPSEVLTEMEAQIGETLKTLGYS